MDGLVEVAEGELERMRVVMEEIRLQATQNQLAIKTICKETAENQSKLVELITRSWDKNLHADMNMVRSIKNN
ncbi:unnamed protein product [Sphenostylis stenocarpa]|uniref:Uncharacterized protein n=1 Tax=Sphenostylis stenocarpa TaxID=92480 RepID=A0AA86VYN1_9FABA|nr:unnamed protein product [Sphenostylis stenocarpa]